MNMTTSYISLDLETTGLNPKTDKIIEIGGVKVIDGVVKETFSTLVNPGRRLESRIVELTGIEDSVLEGTRKIGEVWPELEAFLEDLPLLGHRILFDYSFLKKAAVDLRLPFEKKGLDTLKLARRYLPELPKRNLESLCVHYQIRHKAHRALGDALATHELYRILVEEYYEKTARDSIWQPQSLHYQVKRDVPITPAQKERLQKLLEKHGIEPDFQVEGLMRSEADRIMDLIRSGVYPGIQEGQEKRI